MDGHRQDRTGNRSTARSGNSQTARRGGSISSWGGKLFIDRDQFEERAAIMEFDGGLSRFEAETQAAKAQGLTRWQAMEAIRNGNCVGDHPAARHHREAHDRHGEGDLPGVQRAAAEQDRPLPERHVQA